MDSPLIAGANYRRIPLTNSVALDVIADTRQSSQQRPSRSTRTSGWWTRQ